MNMEKHLGSAVLTKLAPFAGILVFLGVWQAAMALYKMPAYLLSAPTQIFQTFINELPRLLHHSSVTAYEMLLGYGLAVVVAIPLAVAITASQRFDSFVMPQMLFFQVVPKVAIAPLFLVWFGVGTTPKVLVAFLISFFPIVIDATVGLRSMSVASSRWWRAWCRTAQGPSPWGHEWSIVHNRRGHRVPGADPARLAQRARERDAAGRHPPAGPCALRAGRASSASGDWAPGIRGQEAVRAVRRHASARLDLSGPGARSPSC
jgi:hypothetical protein